MSLRTRSTIIRFSARSLGEAASAALARASESSSSPRGAVPFIGRATMRPRGVTRKKSSGDRLRICRSPSSI